MDHARQLEEVLQIVSCLDISTPSTTFDSSQNKITLEIFKVFTFDAAHFLPNVPPEHKCHHMHGHTYYAKVVLEDDLDPQLGWVIDFAILKKAFAPLLEALDHKVLNNIPGLENPTAENIAIWIWDQLIDQFPGLIRVELSETPNSGVVYKGGK